MRTSISWGLRRYGLLTFCLLLFTCYFFGPLASGITQQPPLRRSLPPPRPTIRLEPVAEAKLLMEGMIDPNFRGLEKRLREKPGDVETWKVARGQALLVAEGSNLLMLRPPRNSGQDAWMARAIDLRSAATRLARAAAAEDFERCRTGMGDVANACNRCHQTFRVPVRIVPFAAQPEERKVSRP